MRMDLTVTDYPNRAALDRYMHGSAEVIGLQCLPVLGTVGPAEERPRTLPRSERRSSSPTSCATSTKTSTAAGSTCPPTSSPATAWTAPCYVVPLNRRTEPGYDARLPNSTITPAHLPGGPAGLAASAAAVAALRGNGIDAVLRDP